MLHVVRAGTGRPLLLVHGSAADHTTWSIQMRTLADRFAMTAYDRRSLATVEAEVADAASLLPPGGIVCGSSYGAVVALELARTHPVAGIVLIEPPLAPDDEPLAPGFIAQFDAVAAERGGEAAAEWFLRSVLGPTAFERMPKAFRERAMAKHVELRRDCVALLAYRPRYASLRELHVPALLVGGDKSGPYYRPTLDALARALPDARLEMVPGGHMLHAEAFRRFNELVVEFGASLPRS